MIIELVIKLIVPLASRTVGISRNQHKAENKQFYKNSHFGLFRKNIFEILYENPGGRSERSVLNHVYPARTGQRSLEKKKNSILCPKLRFFDVMDPSQIPVSKNGKFSIPYFRPTGYSRVIKIRELAKSKSCAKKMVKHKDTFSSFVSVRTSP